MNIQQFQYVLAVAEFKFFEQAAERCCVTQSTLSTMIGKFESEIGIKVFDRKTKPVSVTKEGEQIIKQLQIVVKEIDLLDNVVQELKGEISGKLNIGIIPTVAPYILPKFLAVFANSFPNVKIVVQEMTTPEIQKNLKKRVVDIGIAAIPLKDKDLIENIMYEEPFYLFDYYSGKSAKSTDVKDINYERLWLLQEGHCLRNQVEQICELSDACTKQNLNFEFKAGSIDSLIRFTKANKGITLLPHTAIIDLEDKDKRRLSRLTSPVPMRSIGTVVHKHFVKKSLLDELQNIIQNLILPILPNKTNKSEIIQPLK